MNSEMIFCEHCGNKVYVDAVICPSCGYQLKQLKPNINEDKPQIIINNINQNNNNVGLKKCDKWVAFILCLLLGFAGIHKFYEGKAGVGIIYLFTAGIFGVGVIIDLIVILCKPNPYYV